MLVVLPDCSSLCWWEIGQPEMAGSSTSLQPSIVGSGKEGQLPKKSSTVPSNGTWATLVAGTRDPSLKKMKLKFVEPSMFEGKPRVVTAIAISVEGSKRWASTLVGCFVGGSLPFSAVQNIARSIWRTDGLVDVLSIEKGFFLFRFANKEGMTTVVERGPWLFAGRYLVLQKWSPGLPLSKANLSSIPIWAKFHNVPIELWTEEGPSHIASAVGHPLYADAATEACSRIAFARICVEVDATRPLVEEFDVEAFQKDGSSSLIPIWVSYQWRPPCCEVCQVFGHTTSSCQGSAQLPSSAIPGKQVAPSRQQDLEGEPESNWQLVERRRKHSSSPRTSISAAIASSAEGLSNNPEPHLLCIGQSVVNSFF